MDYFQLSASTIHVEVRLTKEGGEIAPAKIGACLEEPLRNYISTRIFPLNQTFFLLTNGENTQLMDHVRTLFFECDTKHNEDFVTENDLNNLVFHFYSERWQEMETEDMEVAGDGQEVVPSSQHWMLPHHDFTYLWENLIYEAGLKEKLLKFALTALNFSMHKINPNVISCNRLILLHGPPGTGKTSLCKALAQKLAIRTQPKYYAHVHFIEINSHSLFSKWFSESGKLVMRLFSKIREIIADPHLLVCVLIDEVESLAYARDSMSGHEPKDAMRVVNALLTQLDSIKESPNVLILATSNLPDTIDLAFVDRADIKQHIGLPSENAIRRIYVTMLKEMMRVGLLDEGPLDAVGKHEDLLSELAKRSIGFSGRTLRKLPFLAHAQYTFMEQYSMDDKIKLSDFLDALLVAVEQRHSEQNSVKKSND